MSSMVGAPGSWQFAEAATASRRPAHVACTYALGAVAVTPHSLDITVCFWI